MARAWTPDGAADSGGFANVFVLVAVVAMLLGTVLILAARDPGAVDVPPGEAVEVLRYEAPEWDPLGHPIRVRFSTNESFNMTAVETTGTGKAEYGESGPGNWSTWVLETTVRPGEAWSVTLTNMGNLTVRAATTVSDNLLYTAGGILVGVGVLGFVSYRMGMRRAGP